MEVRWKNGAGIKFIGTTQNAKNDGMLILADEFPYRTCVKCGSFVFSEDNSEIDYPYYCPCCDENMYKHETEIFERKSYSMEVLRKIWADLSDIPVCVNDEIECDFFLWSKGTDIMEIWHWFDDKCPKRIMIDLINK